MSKPSKPKGTPAEALTESLETLLCNPHVGMHISNSNSLTNVLNLARQGMLTTYARSLASSLLNSKDPVVTIADILMKSGEITLVEYHAIIAEVKGSATVAHAS